MNPEDRMRVMEACYVLPGAGWMMHFGLMMSMSVIVAIMGLSADSPALVIGAMLIAPLMTPVLGVAASISMALSESLIRSAATVVVATAGAVLFAWVIAAVLPGELLTGEVLARTAPDVRDLVVALAAGLAGSYATARPDVSSSLPGVAIAVALVPPLAVVGICLRAGEADLARGALLLYGTNLAAIITVSCAVFVATGFVPGRRLASMAPRVLAGAALGAVVVIALGALLFSRTRAASEEAQTVADIRTATDDWLSGTLDDFTVELNGDRVDVRVSGPDQPPASSELSRRLEPILGTAPDLRVSWTQGQTADSLVASERAAEEAITKRVAVQAAIDDWLAVDGAGSSYDLTDSQIDGDGIALEVASSAPLPPLSSLEARLFDILGDDAAITIEWRDLSSEAQAAGVASIAATEEDLRRAAVEWAAPLEVDVEEVVYDGETVEIELAGETLPDASSLAPLVAEIVGVDTPLDVSFVERIPVYPVPSPTPTPTPLPTPAPTATPVPTPTVDPDAEPSTDADDAGSDDPAEGADPEPDE